MRGGPIGGKIAGTRLVAVRCSWPHRAKNLRGNDCRAVMLSGQPWSSFFWGGAPFVAWRLGFWTWGKTVVGGASNIDMLVLCSSS